MILRTKLNQIIVSFKPEKDYLHKKNYVCSFRCLQAIEIQHWSSAEGAGWSEGRQVIFLRFKDGMNIVVGYN